jgi:hypothetical protein
MIDQPDEQNTGRGALRAYSTSIEPPELLEPRVRRSLIERGLVRTSTPRLPGWMSHVGLLAAGIVIGAFAYSALANTDTRPATQPGQYVLLLLGETPGDTGAVHVAREREYGQWASSLTNGARWVGGHELGDVVIDVGPKLGGAPVVDRLAGYFVIDAVSREIAAEVAATCPHVKYGGRVVVMTIAS